MKFDEEKVKKDQLKKDWEKFKKWEQGKQSSKEYKNWMEKYDNIEEFQHRFKEELKKDDVKELCEYLVNKTPGGTAPSKGLAISNCEGVKDHIEVLNEFIKEVNSLEEHKFDEEKIKNILKKTKIKHFGLFKYKLLFLLKPEIGCVIYLTDDLSEKIVKKYYKVETNGELDEEKYTVLLYYTSKLRKTLKEIVKEEIDWKRWNLFLQWKAGYLDKNENKNTTNNETIIKRIEKYLEAYNFIIPSAYLANYIISLKTKPFVLLAGISGTGKSKLTRIFAEAVNGRRLIDVSLEELYYIFAPVMVREMESEEITELKKYIDGKKVLPSKYQEKWNQIVKDLLNYLKTHEEVLCRMKFMKVYNPDQIDDEMIKTLWEKSKNYPGLGEWKQLKVDKQVLREITSIFLENNSPSEVYKKFKEKMGSNIEKTKPKWVSSTCVLHIITLLRNPYKIFAPVFPNLAQIKQKKIFEKLDELGLKELIGKKLYEEVEKEAKLAKRSPGSREENPELKIRFLTEFYKKFKNKLLPLSSKVISKENQELYDSLITPTGYKLIPVQPDWNDKTGLMGYYNAIEGKYQMTEFLKFIIEAMKNPCVPYFVCLDEMNLARVEYYFNDFLSKMETMDEERGWESEPVELRRVTKKEWNEKKDEEEPFGIPKELWGNEEEGKEEKEGEYKAASIRIPPNLFILGTVNMDETTYQFSPKVLDRANTIEFNIVNVEKYFEEILKCQNGKSDLQACKGIPEVQKFLKIRTSLSKVGGNWKYTDEKEFKINNEKPIDKLQNILNELNDILATRNFHFGYRTMEEITRYVYNACVEFPKTFGVNPFVKDDTLNFYASLDFQILQKILPKINGDRDRVGNVIDRLLNFLLKKSIEANKENPWKGILGIEDAIIDNKKVDISKIKMESVFPDKSEESSKDKKTTIMEKLKGIDFDNDNYIPFIRSIYKLLRMKERLDQFDTTSFYEY